MVNSLDKHIQNEKELIRPVVEPFACGANYPSQERAIFLQRELPAQALKGGLFCILYLCGED